MKIPRRLLWPYNLQIPSYAENLLQDIWWVRIERYDHRPPQKKKKKVSRYVCGGEGCSSKLFNAFEKKRGRINIKSRHMCTGIGMAWYEKEKKKKKKKKYTI